MENIARLAIIVTSRSLPGIPVVDVTSSDKTKEKQLIDELVKNPAVTQNQLIRAIYKQHTPSTLSAFYQLRSRLNTKLHNNLFFLDHSDSRHLVSRQHELHLVSMLHQAKVLMLEAAYPSAIQRLTRCIHLAKRDEFPQYIVQASRQLCAIYVALQQVTKYRAATRELLHWQRILVLEEEAEMGHNEFRMTAGGTVASQHLQLPQLTKYIVRLEEIYAQAKTFNTFFYLYRARLYQQQMLGNYREIVRITEEANQQLEAGQLNSRRFDKRYNHFMMAHGHLGAREAQQGLLLAEEHLQDFHPSSNNWFAYQENHILLAMHADRLFVAQRILRLVTLSPQYTKLRPAARQRWDLYRAYLAVLMPDLSPELRRPVAQWSLMLPDFSKDKRGYHVAVLIVQFLYFLERRDLDEILLRLERLRKYQTKYLRDVETLRSRLFLSLLAIMGRSDFNAKLSRDRGANVLKKLQKAPVPGEAYAEMEIVPYEALWEIVLGLLRDGEPLTVRANE